MKNTILKYPNTLREHRLKLKLTQKEAATKLNLSPSNQDRISKWENGEAKPRIDNLLKLCKMYTTEAKELYPNSV